jgi:hypothetical protein
MALVTRLTCNPQPNKRIQCWTAFYWVYRVSSWLYGLFGGRAAGTTFHDFAKVLVNNITDYAM